MALSQDQLQANPAIRPSITCPKAGPGCSKAGAANTTDADQIVRRCEAALQAKWRPDGNPPFLPCNDAACQFRYTGSRGSVTIKCSALQGPSVPALPFFNPGLCRTGSAAQQALKAACRVNKAFSDLCVSRNSLWIHAHSHLPYGTSTSASTAHLLSMQAWVLKLAWILNAASLPPIPPSPL